MANNVLALDQSSRCTGYAIFSEGQLYKVDKFTLKDTSFAVRLTQFRQLIMNIINEYKITTVLFEEIQLQNNVDTFKKLAMVYGVLLELLNELQIPYEIISSNTWKSKCGIRKSLRPQEKKAAQQFVTDTYGIKVTEDESDAICLGYSYISEYRKEYNW